MDPGSHALDGMHIDATWQIRSNDMYMAASGRMSNCFDHLLQILIHNASN